MSERFSRWWDSKGFDGTLQEISFARESFKAGAAEERERIAKWLELNMSPRNDAYLASYVLSSCVKTIRENKMIFPYEDKWND